MSFKGKHTVEEINGVRCTVVEKGITKERADFLKKLLEFNRLEVIVAAVVAEGTDETYTLGVTDVVFNPTIAVYNLSLKAPEGGKVSPKYWEQQESKPVDQYWLKEEEKQAGGSAWFYSEEK